MKPDELERAEFLKKTKEADHAIFEFLKKHPRPDGARMPFTESG